MNLRNAFAEAMVDGWFGDWDMGRVALHAVRLADQPDGMYLERVCTVAGVKWIDKKSPAKAWVAKNFRSLNEALWDGRKRDAAIAAAVKQMGGKRTGVNMKVSARAEDKRSDWGTCK